MVKNILDYKIVRFSLVVIILTIMFAFPHLAFAADCGDVDLNGVTDAVCVCGDTVKGAADYTYTLTGNLNCTAHGLLFGSNSITIDGGGFTIDGDDDTSNYGIYNDGYDDVTTTDIIITDFEYGIYYTNSANSGSIVNNNVTSSLYGIYFSSSSSNTLNGNTVNSNTIGIYLSSSSGNNILTSNTANLNNNHGIYLSSTSGNNTLTGNTANSNDYGISLFSASNTLTSNTANSNDYGIYLPSTSSSNILTSNTTNLNNLNGISLSTSSDNNLIGNTANSNSYYGISLASTSENNTLTGNTANLNNRGISLASSSSNTLTSNTVNSNSIGIYLSSSSSNTLTSNNLLFNQKLIYNLNSNNSWVTNSFLHSLTNTMVSFTDIDQTIAVNDTISFDFDMLNVDSTACNDCTYTVATYPQETVVITSEADNNVQGNFEVIKSGVYTLTIKVTDTSGNYEKRNYAFIVGDTDSTTKRFYLRDVNTTHGQPKNSLVHGDVKAMVSTAPTEEEWWQCGGWVQNSPDEIPDYYFSNLNSVDIHSWYKQTHATNGYVGIQRFATYEGTVDQSQFADSVVDYTENDTSFSGINWVADYPRSWYWFSVKSGGLNSYWRSTPDLPSYVDFNYSYASAVPVKTISNDEVNLLSATTDSADNNNITIELENPSLTSATTTQTVLTSVNRPFLGISTNIDSASTTTFTTNSISANSNASISTANMEITPESGSVDVLVSSWTDLANKQWTESSSNAENVMHTIGDLKSSTTYSIKIDNVIALDTIIGDNCNNGICTSDENGQIVFTYTGTYSSHTFLVEEETCPTIEHTVTYNIYPTCGPATCESGYILSGANCIVAGGGMPATAVQKPIVKDNATLIIELRQQLIVLITQVLQLLQAQLATMMASR
ncbi:MAG: NosD domain-containing protein [Candidatus Staskawiczbacteria bacterium]|jgi:parallel beta-helix repeat protein